MNNVIKFHGFLDNTNKDVLKLEKEKLEQLGFQVSVYNCDGELYNSVFDFMDVNIVSIGFELLKTIIYNGLYDILKNYILTCWNSTSKNTDKYFTIEIEDILTINGKENIKCKVNSPLTEKERELFIKETFGLVNNIVNNNVNLLERSKYYDAFNAHVFEYNENEKFSEMDVEQRVKELKENGKNESL